MAKYTKKQKALIRRILKLKGLPPKLRQMLLTLLAVTMKVPKHTKHRKSKKQHRKKVHTSKKSKLRKGKRASAAQMRVRRKFKAFIKKHGRRPRKGEHL